MYYFVIINALITFLIQELNTQDCKFNFNVWHPDDDELKLMQNLELQIANMTNYVDKELIHFQLLRLTDLNNFINLTSTCERSLTEIKLHQMARDSDLKDLQMKVGVCQLRLEEFKEEIENSFNTFSNGRLQPKKHVRKDRMLSSHTLNSQSDTPKDLVIDNLKNMVSDLKAEWILIKRDFIAFRSDTQALQGTRMDLLNKTADNKNDIVVLKDTLESLMASEKKLSQKLSSLESYLEHLNQDFSVIKSVQDTVKSDILTTTNRVNVVQATTADIKRELLHLQASQELLKVDLFSRLKPAEVGMDNRVPVSLQILEQTLNHQSGEVPKDCADIAAKGYSVSGVYQVKVSAEMPLDNVYCEIINQIGYTVIQRRTDGLQNFNRGWLEYKIGFGNSYGEFWAGNELIHALTKDNGYGLLIDIWDWEGNKTFAEYDIFSIANEEKRYALNVSRYHGTAGDSLTFHNGMKFSTEDLDNDQHMRNCAAENKGGWWYKDCYMSQLNGVYYLGWYSQSQSVFADGIVWYSIKHSERYSVRKTEMKLMKRSSSKIL